MSKYLEPNEVIKICQERDLIQQIKNAKDNKAAKAIIDDVLPKGKEAKPKFVNEYMEELKKENTSSKGNSNNAEQYPSSEENSDNPHCHPSTDENKNNSTQNASDGEDNNSETNSQNEDKDNYGTGSSKKNKSTKANIAPSEKITGTIEAERTAVLVGEENAKELDSAKALIYTHEKSIELLKNQIEILQQKLKVPSSEETEKANLLSQIPDLNELLNSCNEKITVSINKDLLSKATRFVDNHSLIRLESIIRDGYDLNSTIVQSILFAFIQQNSLL